MKTLQQHRNTLERLRWSVEALRDDITFRRGGGEIVYAADFSEVRAYMFRDPQSVDVGLDPKKYAYQQSLGLNHLFLSLAERIYLLPPYLQELAEYVRWREKNREVAARAKARAMKIDLEPKHWEILRKLGADQALDAQDETVLIQLVRVDLDRICHEVDSIMTRYDQEADIDQLNSLLRERRLVLRYQDVFGDTPIELPAAQEVEDVFEIFPGGDRKGFNKLLDAQALLFVRDANRRLTNTRLYLVTRDEYMGAVVRELERRHRSIWEGVGSCLRNVETVLLDLILRGTNSEDERLAMLEDTERLLTKLDGDARSIADKGAASDGDLVKRSEHVLDEAFRLWEEHLNLRLGMAAREVTWLKNFFAITEAASSTRVEANPKLRLMKNLGKFLFSARYQEMVEGSDEEIWKHLLVERLRMLFLASLGQNRIDAIVEHLAQSVEPVGKGLRSVRYSLVCSLQFVSPQFVAEMQALLASAPGVDWLKNTRAILSKILEEATTGSPTAEGFLFMAFVLAMSGLWEEAKIIAEESLKLWGTRSKAEVYYFIAVATRKIAANRRPPTREDYVAAYDAITTAIAERDAPDPRYLKEQATIILMHREAAPSPSQGGTGGEGSLDRRDEVYALELLERARELAGSDRRLRIQILNNLAFAAVRLPGIPWQQTQERVRQLRAEFGGSRQDDPSLSEPWPMIKDTLAMVRAVGARSSANISGIQEAARGLEAILTQEDVLEVDRATIQGHIEELHGWIAELRNR